MTTRIFARVSAAFALVSLGVLGVLFAGPTATDTTGPRLAETGAQIAGWLIGLVVILLIAGAVFLFLGRRKKKDD